MSVRQNMGYGLKIAGVPKAQINVKVEEAAKQLQLKPSLNREPRQCAAMGRVLVRKPAVVLFDAPRANLDAKLRVQTRLEMRDLQDKLGITSLYGIYGRGGLPERIGTPPDVYPTPSTLLAAQFIGSPAMNVF